MELLLKYQPMKLKMVSNHLQSHFVQENQTRCKLHKKKKSIKHSDFLFFIADQVGRRIAQKLTKILRNSAIMLVISHPNQNVSEMIY